MRVERKRPASNQEMGAEECNQAALRHLASLVMHCLKDLRLEDHAMGALRGSEQVLNHQAIAAWVHEATEEIGRNLGGDFGEASRLTAEAVHLGRIASGAQAVWRLAANGRYATNTDHYDDLIGAGFVAEAGQVGMSVSQFLGTYDHLLKEGATIPNDTARHIVGAYADKWAVVPHESWLVESGAYKAAVIRRLSRVAQSSLREPGTGFATFTNNLMQRAASVAPVTGIAMVVGAVTAPQVATAATVASYETIVASPDAPANAFAENAGAFLVATPEPMVVADPNPTIIASATPDTIIGQAQPVIVAETKLYVVADPLNSVRITPPGIRKPQIEQKVTGSTREQRSFEGFVEALRRLNKQGKWDGDIRELAKIFDETAKKYKHVAITREVLAADAFAESLFDKDAMSHAGARGMTQFMPGTWKDWGKDRDGDGRAEITNPRESIDAQARYLIHIYEEYAQPKFGTSDNALWMTLAGYNAGPGRIQSQGLDLINGGGNWKEPTSYVKRIKGFMRQIDQAEKRYVQKHRVSAKRTTNKVANIRQSVEQESRVDYAYGINPRQFRKSEATPKSPRTPIKRELQRRGYKNGRLESQTVRVGDEWGSARLHPQAAEAFRAMSAAFKARFGDHIEFNGEKSDYRSYEQQKKVFATSRPGFAAEPGGSSHGWGLAADLNLGGFDSQRYQWMKENAITYGFVHPYALREGSSIPEPWHWEYNAKLRSEYAR